MPTHRYEIIIEVLALMGMIYITYLMIMQYGMVPDKVPTDYNLKGEPDGWGDKSSLLLIYIVGLILYVGLSVLGRYPHLYNFPVKITENNIRIQYRFARTLLNSLKLGLVAIYTALIVAGINHNQNEQNIFMGKYFIYFALAVIFIPIIIYCVLSTQKK